MTSYYSADLSTISAAGTSLNNVSSTIAASNNFGALSGADDFADLQSAVSDYNDKWQNALTRLQTSTGDLGTTAAAIVQIYQEYEAANTKAWGGGAGSAGGGAGGGGRYQATAQ